MVIGSKSYDSDTKNLIKYIKEYKYLKITFTFHCRINKNAQNKITKQKTVIREKH